jgi:hypothetical protein
MHTHTEVACTTSLHIAADVSSEDTVNYLFIKFDVVDEVSEERKREREREREREKERERERESERDRER